MWFRGVASRVVVCAAFATSLSGVSREAIACSLPAPGWNLVGVMTGIPANGVLVVGYSCYLDCRDVPDPESFTLTTAEGDAVPGEVVLSSQSDIHYLVFRPEPGVFVAGETYTATLEGTTSPVNWLVEPDLTWTESITLTEEVSEIDQPAGDTVSCTGPLDSCGNGPKFTSMIDRKTAVAVTWGDATRPDTMTQYAYRILRSGDVDLPVPWQWAGGSAGFELAEDEDSTCYVLELQKLVDGSVQTFEERCVERPDTFTPGLQPNPNIGVTLDRCEAPPDGYLDEWCTMHEECLHPSNDVVCTRFLELCSGPPGGEGGGAGVPPVTGGSTGDAGSGGTGHAASGGASGSATGEAGESSGDDGDGERVYTKGCGCSLPGSGSQSSATLAFAALGLAALGLRRRRSS